MGYRFPRWHRNLRNVILQHPGQTGEVGNRLTRAVDLLLSKTDGKGNNEWINAFRDGWRETAQTSEPGCVESPAYITCYGGTGNKDFV